MFTEILNSVNFFSGKCCIYKNILTRLVFHFIIDYVLVTTSKPPPRGPKSHQLKDFPNPIICSGRENPAIISETYMSTSETYMSTSKTYMLLLP